MSIKSLIMQTLSPLGVDVCFLERSDDGTFPFIVYNISEMPVCFSDDDEEAILYLVTINIFSRPDYNYESLKNQVIDSMKSAGFKKTGVPDAEYLELQDVYNQPIGFSYFN